VNFSSWKNFCWNEANEAISSNSFSKLKSLASNIKSETPKTFFSQKQRTFNGVK
jgi:hypothetical protein